jgi:hypothetical protein
MNVTRHPQLKDRMGIKPPDVAKAPPLETPDEAPARKPQSLQSWHYDPQLFRKWPQYATAERGAGEQSHDPDLVDAVSLGL